MSHISVYDLSSLIISRKTAKREKERKKAEESILLEIKKVNENTKTIKAKAELENLINNKTKEEQRHETEKAVIKELERNFMEVIERQQDAEGNVKILMKLNTKAVPNKTGDIELIITNDEKLKVDVSNSQGKSCKELTKTLDMLLGAPIYVKYKPEYYDTKTPLIISKKEHDK